MNLFNKEKELIFRITNAVLLLWLITSTVVLISTTINYFIKEPKTNYTYEEYKLVYCDIIAYDIDVKEEDMSDERCLINYKDYSNSDAMSNYYKVTTIYGSLANLLVVGSVMFILNKKKK